MEIRLARYPTTLTLESAAMNTFTQIDRREIIWTDKNGVTHLCEGASPVDALRDRCATRRPGIAGRARERREPSLRR